MFIEIETISKAVTPNKNFRAVWPQLGDDGVRSFRMQMLNDPFPRNKDGTKRYANSTKLLNAFRYSFGEDFIEWFVDSVYGRVQFQGGTTHPRVTAKSRKFFWAMYYQSKNEKWRRMALTKRDSFTVMIRPANPFYLGQELLRQIKQRLSNNIFGVKSN